MQTLEASRIILRDWNENDVDDFFEYAKNPNVGPNAGWPPHTDKSVSLEIIKSFIKSKDVWAIVHKASKKVIGSFKLNADEKRANPKAFTIGYVLSEDYWGKGLMSEALSCILEYAFTCTDIEIISVYHFPFNFRSKSVIDKAGFKFEGVLRKSVLNCDGKIYDSVCYSMTKDEYLKKTITRFVK